METEENRKGDNRSIHLPPPPPISLRPFDTSESDIDGLVALAADAAANRFLRRGPFASRDDAVRFLHDKVLPHPWYRAICLPDGRLVGSISLRPGISGDGAPRSASLGYRVAPKFRCRGIATEAVRAATAAAFEEWPELERVEAVADVENPASQRVLEKAGFAREAVLRDYMVLKGESRDVIMYSCMSRDRMARKTLKT
ncbi:hypothetical protein KSP39_PZI021137 [Platanthera zijinensis]|uniref:N-acetyltransferase domain-containing protein n=1 Tax=Platanthera zijinensis TaxID=2320716 RepID=A0AAP0AYT0_9ASPA